MWLMMSRTQKRLKFLVIVRVILAVLNMKLLHFLPTIFQWFWGFHTPQQFLVTNSATSTGYLLLFLIFSVLCCVMDTLPLSYVNNNNNNNNNIRIAHRLLNYCDFVLLCCQEIVVMLEEQMNALVQAEMSVLVDILYHPEVLFHSSLPVDHGGISSGGFMTKYEQILPGPAVFRGMRIFTPRCGIRLQFAAEFAACRRRTLNCPFFATFISNSRFFRLLFNFTIYKIIKSSRKLWFCALTLRQSLTQDNLRARCAVFFNNSKLFWHLDDIFIISGLI